MVGRFFWVCISPVAALLAVVFFTAFCFDARALPAQLLEAAAFPYVFWSVISVGCALMVVWLVPRFFASAPSARWCGFGFLLCTGVAMTLSPVFSLPWTLLIDDGGFEPSTVDAVISGMWAPGIGAVGLALLLGLWRGRRSSIEPHRTDGA